MYRSVRFRKKKSVWMILLLDYIFAAKDFPVFKNLRNSLAEYMFTQYK